MYKPPSRGTSTCRSSNDCDMPCISSCQCGCKATPFLVYSTVMVSVYANEYGINQRLHPRDPNPKPPHSRLNQSRLSASKYPPREYGRKLIFLEDPPFKVRSPVLSTSTGHPRRHASPPHHHHHSGYRSLNLGSATLPRTRIEAIPHWRPG